LPPERAPPPPPVQKLLERVAGIAFGDLRDLFGRAATSPSEQDAKSIATDFWVLRGSPGRGPAAGAASSDQKLMVLIVGQREKPCSEAAWPSAAARSG